MHNIILIVIMIKIIFKSTFIPLIKLIRTNKNHYGVYSACELAEITKTSVNIADINARIKINI